MLWSDDGIVIRLPEAMDHIPLEELLFDPEEIEDEVVEALPGTALFARVPRGRGARAAAPPPPARRAHAAVAAAPARRRPARGGRAATPTFPMLLETTRECLRDVFDVPALREVMGDLRSRERALVPVDTERASPFAQSLLFGWIARVHVRGRRAAGRTRAAALALDRDLLRELLGAEELRELLDPAALAELELELQRLHPMRRGPRDADDAPRPPPRPRGLDGGELGARSTPADLPVGRRAVARAERSASGGRRVPIHRGRGRVGLPRRVGRAPPVSPRRSPVPGHGPIEDLVSRYARTHGPFVAALWRTRLGPGAERARRRAASVVETDRRVAQGEFRPDGAEREWSDAGSCAGSAA